MLLPNECSTLSSLNKEPLKRLEYDIRFVSDSNFAPTSVDHHLLPETTLNRHGLVKDVSIPKKVINLYISYTLTPWLENLNTGFILNNCLFGSAKLTKNADPDKCKYSNHGIGLDFRWEFLFTDVLGGVVKTFLLILILQTLTIF